MQLLQTPPVYRMNIQEEKASKHCLQERNERDQGNAGIK